MADVTFRNNVIRHTAAGVNILGTDDIHPSQQAQRIKIKNNLFLDIGGGRWGGNGRLFQIVAGPANVQIDHNTALQTYNVITADGDPATAAYNAPPITKPRRRNPRMPNCPGRRADSANST